MRHAALSMPGRVIEFPGGMDELHDFETSLPRLMGIQGKRRVSAEDLWLGRKTLAMLMRPPGAIGNLRATAVETAIMDDPVDTYLAILQAATTRFTSGGRHKNAWTAAAEEAARDSGLGFTVSALDAVHGGLVVSDAWYFPYLNPRNGLYVNRAVTMPQVLMASDRIAGVPEARIAYPRLQVQLAGLLAVS